MWNVFHVDQLVTEIDSFIRVVVDEWRRNVAFDFLAKRSTKRSLKQKILVRYVNINNTDKIQLYVTLNVNIRLSFLNDAKGRCRTESFFVNLKINIDYNKIETRFN